MGETVCLALAFRLFAGRLAYPHPLFVMTKYIYNILDLICSMAYPQLWKSLCVTLFGLYSADDDEPSVTRPLGVLSSWLSLRVVAGLCVTVPGVGSRLFGFLGVRQNGTAVVPSFARTRSREGLELGVIKP